MKKPEKKKEAHQPEVETPRPPQVMDASRPPEPDSETATINEIKPKETETENSKQGQPK